MSDTLVRISGEPEDPFLWLEQTHDPAALAWSSQRTAGTKAALGAIALYPKLRAELDAALKLSAPAPSFFYLGNRLARFRKDLDRQHGVLELAERDAEGRPTTWKAIFDLDAFNKAKNGAYTLQRVLLPKFQLPPDFNRCLLPLAPDGGDELELHEFDLQTGKFIEDGFHTEASYVEAVWLNANQLLIAHTLGGAPFAANRRSPAQVFLWDRGTPLAKARPVFRLDSADVLMFMDAIGTGASRVGVVTCIHDYQTFSYAVIDQQGAVHMANIPPKLKSIYLTVTQRHFFVQLAEEADVAGVRRPAESLIAYDVHPDTPDAERVSFVHLLGDDEFINDDAHGFAGTRTKLHFITDKHTRHRALTARFNDGRWEIDQTVVAVPGAVLKFGIFGASGDIAGDEVCIQETGFLTPSRFELLAPGRKPIVLHTDAPLIDATGFVAEVRTAKSKDGTPVDYHLLRPKQPAVPGFTPTLMTGYGALSASCKPSYFDPGWLGGHSLKLWLDRGGAVVVPLIRGGAEKGEAWHAAAMQEKRQNSYDDFHATAEDLIASGFTTPDHLGVFGSSNGGLLSGTVAVQRPDLYGAAVVDAPLLDMLRYHKAGIGGGLISEYGDPEDPAMRKVLLGYSPYQNLQPGRSYPPFLVTVATSDDRVDPGHARKFVARCEEIGTRVWFIEESEGGHGVSDSVTHPDLMSMRMAFLIDALM